MSMIIKEILNDSGKFMSLKKLDIGIPVSY